jgi:hypothetical protein
MRKKYLISTLERIEIIFKECGDNFYVRTTPYEGAFGKNTGEKL